MNGNQLALRPLRHFADFGGRSTRGELFYFTLLLGVLGLPIAAVDLILPPGSSGWAGLFVSALIACPVLAMCVRRLHDVGWRGWWILALFPATGLAAWNAVQRLLHPLVYPPARPPLPDFVGLAATGLALAIMILVLWDDDPETNRYGPNPRYGQAGEPA